jgi:urease accessory protein
MDTSTAAIAVRVLPPGQDRVTPADRMVVEIAMTAHDRRRVRRLIEAPDGTRLALELATGTVLHPGQVLHRAGGRAYVVTAEPEDVIVARPHDLAEAARVGHLIGNLHRDIETDGGDVIALADSALADRLTRAGVPFERRRRAFHGRAPGEHAH